jgi:parallel beta-helix repeat protein
LLKYSVLFFLTIISLFSRAATYYISSSGNDGNNGSISSPWRTIGRVNSVTLQAGDQVLFERGGTYRGSLYINQSGTAASPITIGAYGSGNAPLFVGSQLAANWVVHQGNIWKTQISASRVAHLFYNDSLLPIARFPNTGWLRSDNGSPTQINDSELNQPSGYWNGATVVVRSTAWSYDTANVTSYTTGVLNMTSIVYNLSTYNWGYFLRNKFELLDAPGEWFYDRATSTLYLYPITSNPNTSTVEIVTAFQEGDGCGISVNWQRSNVVIENLAFKNYGYAGVRTSGSNNVTVRNCSFDKCDDGIRAYGNGQTFLNNTLTRCRKIGIDAISGPGYGNNNLIENNTITDCAIYPGLGKSNWGYFGLSCTGANNVIRGNRLTRIGYIALSFSGNCLVENNVIQNACFILSDGSGIAFDQTDGAIIRKNIVLSTLGSVESCATNFTGCDPKGKGIYFGNISNRNNIVEENTVAYCNGAGIWFDHTMVQTGNQIRNNILFGNNLYQFGVSDYSNYNGPGATSPYAVASYPNQSVTGNIFYSTVSNQRTMYHINRWFSGVDFADFNENRYINPWDTSSIEVFNIAGNSNPRYSLNQWRSIRGDDLLASNAPYLPSSSPSDHILVYNSTTSTQSMPIPSGTWKDLDGTTYQNSVEVDSFQSVPLYRAPLPPLPAATPSTDKSLLVQANAGITSITLTWSSYASSTGYTIHRKLKSSTSWGSALATLSGSSTQWTDNTPLPNTYYEYRITRNSSAGTAYGYVSSAIQLAPTEDRGKMVLVVDNTFTSSLASELEILQSDLQGDGWNVIRIDVSRTATPASIRAQIQSIYTADPTSVKSVFLFGHVPVYRSGNIAPDGHSAIPWAADSYYGEMNSAWSSSQTTLPSDVELEVGRVDLFNLPAFGTSEQQLLSNYLNKLHEFKTRQYIPQNRSIIQDNLSYVSNPLAETGYRTSGPLVGISNITDIPPYNFPNWTARMFEGWLWGYFSGGGSYNSADGIGNTQTFVNGPNNVIFNMTLGSYFGNWDSSSPVPNWDNNNNNLLRATIASGKALTSVWAGIPNWFFHHMGLGDPIGYSTRISMNNRTSSSTYLPQNGGWQGQGYTTIHLGLMGDPSLRMKYLASPSNLTITPSGSNLTFSWTASSESVDGYYLYQIVNGSPVRAHPNLITGTSITGNFSSVPGTRYMVRSVKLENNFSGSFFNLSLGASNEVPQPQVCTLTANVWLQGPFNGFNMNDGLRTAGIIPTADPYPTLGYSHIGGGGATTSAQVLAVSGNNAIVDWVVIEIRNATTPSQRVYSTSALLQRDGDVVATDGVSAITIPLPPGQYHVAIKHRNHLGVMTASPVNLTTGSQVSFISSTTWGIGGMETSGGIQKMWAGDVTFDGVIKYTGSGNDRDPILSRIGGVIPTNTAAGYFQEDTNLSGTVKYTGSDNDRDLILLNIGGVVPTTIKTQQIP